MQVLGIVGEGVAALVGLVAAAAPGEVVAHHAELLVHIAADVDALVAGHAAVLLEFGVAGFLVGGDGVALAAQVAVEARIRRDQRALVTGDGVAHIGRRQALAVGGGEGAGVAGV